METTLFYAIVVTSIPTLWLLYSFYVRFLSTLRSFWKIFCRFCRIHYRSRQRFRWKVTENRRFIDYILAVKVVHVIFILLVVGNILAATLHFPSEKTKPLLQNTGNLAAANFLLLTLCAMMKYWADWTRIRYLTYNILHAYIGTVLFLGIVVHVSLSISFLKTHGVKNLVWALLVRF